MGYSTSFNGTVKLNKQLSQEDKTFLTKLSETRRMARNIEGYGVEGEFYVDSGLNDYDDPTVVNHNQPPSTQPGLWCQWTPTQDGWGIEWDEGEKFYEYVEWLQYIIDWIAPKGYIANGEIEWYGEDRDDMGKIIVKNNQITIKHGKISYEE